MKRTAADAALGDAEFLPQVVARLRSAPYDAATHVRFRVGDREFHAHRWLVEMRMEKYGHALQSGFAESARNEWAVDGHEPAVFEQLLDYLYSDECETLASIAPDRESVIDLWMLANELLFRRLARACFIKFSARLNRTSCAEALRVAIVRAFAPARDAAWNYIESAVATDKGSVQLEWAKTMSLSRRLGRSIRPLYEEVEAVIYEQDEVQVPAADQVRMLDVFVHMVDVAPFSELVFETQAHEFLREAVPLYDMRPSALLTLQPHIAWITDSVVVDSIRQRMNYLETLAATPRALSRKPVDRPLEFMPLDPLLGWARDNRDWVGFSPLRHSSSTLTAKLSCDVANNKEFWFVGDHPSVQFGFKLKEAPFDADIEIGLLSTVYPTKKFVVSFKLRVRASELSHPDGDPNVRFPEASKVDVNFRRGDAAEWLADFQIAGRQHGSSSSSSSSPPQKFEPGRDLFMPAVCIRLLERGELTVKMHGTRWPGDRSPFATD